MVRRLLVGMVGFCLMVGLYIPGNTAPEAKRGTDFLTGSRASAFHQEGFLRLPPTIRFRSVRMLRQSISSDFRQSFPGYSAYSVAREAGDVELVRDRLPARIIAEDRASLTTSTFSGASLYLSTW